MESEITSLIKDQISGCKKVMTDMLSDEKLLKQIEDCSIACIESLNSGGIRIILSKGVFLRDVCEDIINHLKNITLIPCYQDDIVNIFDLILNN